MRCRLLVRFASEHDGDDDDGNGIGEAVADKDTITIIDRMKSSILRT